MEEFEGRRRGMLTTGEWCNPVIASKGSNLLHFDANNKSIISHVIGHWPHTSTRVNAEKNIGPKQNIRLQNIDSKLVFMQEKEERSDVQLSKRLASPHLPWGLKATQYVYIGYP